jgi:hypothetical protein
MAAAVSKPSQSTRKTLKRNRNTRDGNQAALPEEDVDEPELEPEPDDALPPLVELEDAPVLALVLGLGLAVVLPPPPSPALSFLAAAL